MQNHAQGHHESIEDWPAAVLLRDPSSPCCNSDPGLGDAFLQDVFEDDTNVYIIMELCR
jgi:hypothetical protein